MSSHTVLIVDDDSGTREALAQLLADEGYAVDTAASGRHALEAIQHRPPALVLLDVRLPDLHGTEVLAHLHAIGTTVPVLTMSASPLTIDLSAHYPVVGHMVKPFDIDELLDAAARAVG